MLELFQPGSSPSTLLWWDSSPDWSLSPDGDGPLARLWGWGKDYDACRLFQQILTWKQWRNNRTPHSSFSNIGCFTGQRRSPQTRTRLENAVRKQPFKDISELPASQKSSWVVLFTLCRRLIVYSHLFTLREEEEPISPDTMSFKQLTVSI